MSDLLGFGPLFPCSLVPPLGMGMVSVGCSTVEAHNLYLILLLRFVLGLRRAFGGVNSVGPVKIMKWTECSLHYYRHEPGGGGGRKLGFGGHIMGFNPWFSDCRAVLGGCERHRL